MGSLKRRIKQSITRLSELAGYAEGRLKAQRGYYILAYHRILTAEEAYDSCVQDVMWTSPETFRRHLMWMQRVGHLSSTDRLADDIKSGNGPYFYITFDDGWIDNYAHAFPILEEFNAKATLFVATHAIDTQQIFWADYFWQRTQIALRRKPDLIDKALHLRNVRRRSKPPAQQVEAYLEDLKLLDAPRREEALITWYDLIGQPERPSTPSLLSWSQLQEMANKTFIIGSHTHTHMILDNADEIQITQELRESKEILEKRLERPVTEFCYPNARYDSVSRNLVATAGYDRAFCIDNRRVRPNNDPYLIPRFLVYEDLCGDLEFLKLRLLETPWF